MQSSPKSEYWGYYLEDLLEVFDCPEHGGISADEFFRRYGKMILNTSCYYYLYSNEKEMQAELENYRIVAKAHTLTLSVGKIPEAIANFSAAMTCIVCTE